MACHSSESAPDSEFYEDTCEDHRSGCHVEFLEPGVEFHPYPAYKRPPVPGALEAEIFDEQIIDAEQHVLDLRAARTKAHNDAYRAGMNGHLSGA
jgi:hypothetical protein